jgi:hypothetical protein
MFRNQINQSNKQQLRDLPVCFICTPDPVGSLFKWIRNNLSLLDSDPYWECGSGTRSIEVDEN